MLGKKNLALFLVTAIVLVMVYFFEEMPTQKRLQEAQTSGLLLDEKKWRELIGIKNANFEVKKNQEDFYFLNERLPVSKSEINRWLKELAQERIKSTVSTDEPKNWPALPDSYLETNTATLTFKFKNALVQFKLGKKLPLSQEYYVHIILQQADKISHRLIVVGNNSAEEGIYQEKDYAKSDHKYLQFKSLILLPKEMLIDRQIIPEILAEKIKDQVSSIEIDNFRNPPFKIEQIKSENKLTRPLPPMGLESISQSVVSAYIKNLFSQKALEVYPSFDAQKLKTEIGKITLNKSSEGNNSANDLLLELKLYRQYGILNGLFVAARPSGLLYKIEARDSVYFTAHVQDFWDKRLSAKAPTRVRLEFPAEKNKRLDLFFDPTGKAQLMDESSQHLQVLNQEAIQKLKDFVLKDASSTGENVYPELALKIPNLKIALDGREFNLYQVENELIAMEKNGKFQLHYYLEQLPLIEFSYAKHFSNFNSRPETKTGRE